MLQIVCWHVSSLFGWRACCFNPLFSPPPYAGRGMGPAQALRQSALPLRQKTSSSSRRHSMHTASWRGAAWWLSASLPSSCWQQPCWYVMGWMKVQPCCCANMPGMQQLGRGERGAIAGPCTLLMQGHVGLCSPCCLLNQVTLPLNPQSLQPCPACTGGDMPLVAISYSSSGTPAPPTSTHPRCHCFGSCPAVTGGHAAPAFVAAAAPPKSGAGGCAVR